MTATTDAMVGLGVPGKSRRVVADAISTGMATTPPVLAADRGIAHGSRLISKGSAARALMAAGAHVTLRRSICAAWTRCTTAHLSAHRRANQAPA